MDAVPGFPTPVPQQTPNPLAPLPSTARPALPPRPPVPPPTPGLGRAPEEAAEVQSVWAEGSTPVTPALQPPETVPGMPPVTTPALQPPESLPGMPPAQEKAPIEGTRAADLAAQKAAAASMDPMEKASRIAELEKQTALFSKAKMDAPTSGAGALSETEAAAQRISAARELMIQREALGLDPKAGMDPRVTAAAEEQQKRVDELAVAKSELTPEQQAVAKMAADQRALQNSDPGAVKKGDNDEMRKRMEAAGIGQKELDAMPPERRLLMFGFSPDEIADHFTARDKDADVLRDPNDPTNPDRNTAGRGETGGPKAGGDKNMDGTTRRPMTPDEAQRAVDINSVLDMSWHEGNQFGKIVPENTVGDLQTGHATRVDSAGKASDYGDKSSQKVIGDVGEKINTSRRADGSSGAPTGADQVQAAGLDYPTSPYTDSTGTKMSPSVENNQVHRLEGTITKDMEDKAEVCLGAAVMHQAQVQSKALAAAGDDAYVPKMLRRDDSADQMPGVMQRNRESQDDPRTGLGYSTTERLNLPVVPNQERTISPKNAAPMPSTAQVTRSDLPGQPLMVRDPTTGNMVPASGTSQTDQDALAALQQKSQDRVDLAKSQAAGGSTP